MSMWQTPAIVVVFLTWLLSPPGGFADAARREALRRELLPKASRSLTNEDVAGMPRRALPTAPVTSADPAAGAVTPAAPDAAKDATKKDVEAHDEGWWHARMTAARDALERDQLLAESLQGRVNSLTNEASARDDPAQRQQLYEQRTRAVSELDHMKDQLLTDQKTIDAIQEEARTQNVPAGWIR
jgi:hypothetical protein